MAGYSQITQAQFIAALAERLQDTGNVYWSQAELRLYLAEALHTWQAMTGWYRSRVQVPVAAGMQWYDLGRYTLKDTDVLSVILYHLLEPQLSSGAWAGSEQFDLNLIRQSMQNRLDKFLAETRLVVNRYREQATVDSTGRVPYQPQTIDVLRAVWTNAPPPPPPTGPVAGDYRQFWMSIGANYNQTSSGAGQYTETANPVNGGGSTALGGDTILLSVTTGLMGADGGTASATGTMQIDSSPLYSWNIPNVPVLGFPWQPTWMYFAQFQPPIAVNRSTLSTLTVSGNYTRGAVPDGYPNMALISQATYNSLPWDKFYDGPYLFFDTESNFDIQAAGASGGLYITSPMTFQTITFYVSSSNGAGGNGPNAHYTLLYQYAALASLGTGLPFTVTVGGNSYSVTLTNTQPTATLTLPNPVTIPAGATAPALTWTLPVVQIGTVYLSIKVS